MKFADEIDRLPANCFVYGDYHDGFYQCRDEAVNIARKSDHLISELITALENRHADDIVDELKEKYGL